MQPRDFERYPPQNPVEFEWLCGKVRDLQPVTLMEVGSRHGRSLLRLVEAAMPAVRRVVAVDLPNAKWGDDSADSLVSCVAHLKDRMGLDVRLFLADSSTVEVGDAVDNGVDFLFLDADHSYAGVRGDFERFSPMVNRGGLIALHDIKNTNVGRRKGVEVYRFWEEVKAIYDGQTEECVAEGSVMGTGLIRVAHCSVLTPSADGFNKVS